MATIPPKTRNVDTDQLEGLRTLYERLQLREAEHTAARAAFGLEMTRLFIEFNLDTRTHAICLHCGTFNRQGTACGCPGARA